MFHEKSRAQADKLLSSMSSNNNLNKLTTTMTVITYNYENKYIQQQQKEKNNLYNCSKFNEMLNILFFFPKRKSVKQKRKNTTEKK